MPWPTENFGITSRCLVYRCRAERNFVGGGFLIRPDGSDLNVKNISLKE